MVHWVTWISCTTILGSLAFILAEAIPIFNYLLALVGSLCFAPLAIVRLPVFLIVKENYKKPNILLLGPPRLALALRPYGLLERGRREEDSIFVSRLLDRARSIFLGWRHLWSRQPDHLSLCKWKNRGRLLVLG